MFIFLYIYLLSTTILFHCLFVGCHSSRERAVYLVLIILVTSNTPTMKQILWGRVNKKQRNPSIIYLKPQDINLSLSSPTRNRSFVYKFSLIGLHEEVLLSRFAISLNLCHIKKMLLFISKHRQHHNLITRIYGSTRFPGVLKCRSLSYSISVS